MSSIQRIFEDRANRKHFAPMKIDIIDYKHPIKFEDCIIRKMTNNEIVEFLGIRKATIDENGNSGDIMIPNDDSNRYESLPRRMFDSLYLIEFGNFDDTDNLRNILYSFKLYKTGDVFAPRTFNKVNSGYSCIYPEFTNYPIIYRIKKDEISSVIALYRNLIKCKKDKTQLVIERFESAIASYTSWTNTFIELTSIIESIIVDEPFELRFRFSLYSTFILNHYCNIKVTIKEMKNIYDIRSQLIHTGKSKGFSPDKLNTLSTICISIIRWYIENGEQMQLASNLVYNKLDIK